MPTLTKMDKAKPHQKVPADPVVLKKDNDTRRGTTDVRQNESIDAVPGELASQPAALKVFRHR